VVAGELPAGPLVAERNQAAVDATGQICHYGLFRRSAEGPEDVPTLCEATVRVEQLGFFVLQAEDIAEWELERGWLISQQKLQQNEAHYRELMGDAWVQQAYKNLDADIAQWRSGQVGNARIVAVRKDC